ncbi:leucine-rich repeat-containing protein 47 [Dunckerocampus dactyliophorus]|uniref:leucine-rich repeat-containing protein 47-like n=1 Tax=Dunckerocampus dactyliophorus TaxID=161453 RepID=UPI002405A0AE|nr:leucine-rich repeat-containing protein 47-like [Dunckerocampus dactyliophorus]XP_054648854.1 leucine-rich repeat-containing protein 47 [Dunckerocampus dactyliophorus]
MDDMKTWPEVEKAATEKRRELVLQGAAADKKISTHGGLTPAVYSLTLLNYLEVSQCPSLTELHDDIQHLSNLQSLILCRNKLACIPDVIGSLKSLKVLDVSVNNLKFLPEGVAQLQELTTLNVSCNSLEALPNGLSHCTKLSTINVSKNRIAGFPEDLYSERLGLLSTLVASDNAIVELSRDIHMIPALKLLDLSNNKLSEIPSTLSDCPKLKEINFKGNKLNDKRLEKMMNGCQTKSILDYLRGKGRHGEESGDVDGGRNADKKKRQQQKKKNKTEGDDDEVAEVNKMVVRILHVSDAPATLTVRVSAEVKDVRPYFVCCVVRGLNLKSGNALKRFLIAQTKLHEEICGKRTIATIATHDVQLLKHPLVYEAKPPTQLKIVPLGRKEMTAVELIRHLQLEADELRKQKKRQNVTGLHKYLQLLQGKALYPCLVDAEGHVISFPPITNSEKTKIKKTTKELFLEVTSASSLQICKDVMNTLIAKMAELNKFTAEHQEEAGSGGEGDITPPDQAAGADASCELTVQQVRTVDQDGNLKVVYPSKTDLSSKDIPNLTVIW